LRWYNESQKKSLVDNKKYLLLLIIPIVVISIQSVFAVDLVMKPDADTGVDWSREVGCTGTTHWDCLNEPIRDDSDYIESNLISTSNNDIDFIGLSDIADPLKDTDHVLTYTAREANLGTNDPQLIVELLQGSTVIVQRVHAQGTLNTTGFTLYQYPLTTAEASLITDYTNLEIRLMTDCPVGCSAGSARERVQVSFIEFEVRDQAILLPPVLDNVVNIDATTQQLLWTPPLDISPVVSYNIESDIGTGFIQVGNVPVGTNTLTISGLFTDTVYRYRVISLGSSETSSPSNIITKSTTLNPISFSISRPDSDPSVRWVNGIGCSNLNTFNCINEEFRNDNDYVQSVGISGNTDTQFYTMSDISDPGQSTGHILRYVVSEASEGTNTVGLTIELRQSAVVISTISVPYGTIPITFTEFQYVLSTAEADSITNYNNLEITMIADCVGTCSSGPSNTERVRVSLLEFEIIPIQPLELIRAEPIDSSTIRLIWTFINPGGVTGINVERDSGSGFITIANLSPTDITFDDTSLSEGLYTYRLNAIGTGGGLSNELTVAIAPSQATIQTQGAILEPGSLNSLTNEQRQIFAQTTEHFKIDPFKVKQIIDDLEINQVNAYEVILKMLNGTFDNSGKMKNLGSFYAKKYLDISDVNQFLQQLADDSVLALGGSNGTGDNPNFGNPIQSGD